MKLWLFAFLPLISCTTNTGGFCDVYTAAQLTREAAQAIVTLDRPAAEAIAVNEELWRSCER